MHKYLISILIFSCFLCRAQDYKLVWSEEFDYEGVPDPSVWKHEHGFVRNNELQWYQPANAVVSNGILTITGKKETVANTRYEEGSGDWRRNRKNAEYTSSCIKTVGTKEFLYGRFEVRAKIPTASGSWPAIWTLGNAMPWPSCGEIDIMEYYRINDIPHILANTAWGTDKPHSAKWDTQTVPFSKFTDKDPGWANKFHIWRMDWDEEAIRLYLDDELLNETLLKDTHNGSIGNHKNPFRQPHYILLNLAIGGNNGGAPDNPAFPLKYEIDYVRVYQKNQSEAYGVSEQTRKSFHPGALWHDNNGVHINAHGGGILFHENKYYWFGEHKGEHSNNALTGVTCYSSVDLYNWRYEGVALPVSDDETSDIISGCIIERPKVIYNAKTKKFVMYFHLELKGQGYAAARVGIAVADHATGPYKYLKSYRPNAGRFPENMTETQKKAVAKPDDFQKWWTPEWRKAVDDGLFIRRDLEGGQMSRDMTLFVDDDGKACHIYASEENLTLHLAELSDDYLSYTGKYIRIAPGGHNEAPAIFKKDGRYYMITSGCTGWAPNAARLFTADNLWGTWTEHPNPCAGDDAHLTFHAQSTFILPVEGKKDAFIFMADRWTPRHPIDGRYIWLPVRFENGLPVLKWTDEWDLDVFELNEENRLHEKETFEIGKQTFLLNGKPFIIKAAELHYPRIPQAYWEHRIKMCKALGMNAICLYVFWNIHEQEEGKFDFSGNNDVAAFCRLAQKHGMYLILRPGPYVCAEWEMGGLPWWLLKKKDIALRTQDPYFMERVRLFMNEVGKQLSGFQLSKGGNILMVQVENEYGAYGIDKPYIAEIRDIVKTSGFGQTTLFQCDWNSNFENNALDDLFWTINFGTGANIDEQFSRLKKLRPDSPLMCGELWSGWFDHWGALHETRSAEELASGMKEMLDKNISFSLYMTHGGTSFGHWAGANFPGYVPDCTSYDYDAPVSESGRTTPKYFLVRNLLQSYLPEGKTLSDIPDSIPTISIPTFTFEKIAPLFDNLPEPVSSENIRSMEYFNQGWGSILYRTRLKAVNGQQIIRVTEVHDWAQVFIDGKKLGTLNRLKGESSLPLPPVREGAVLDILVEAMGRRNFGAGVIDYKGITEKVEIVSEQGVTELKNWKVYSLPVDYDFAENKNYQTIAGTTATPAYYRTTFSIDKTGDTFLDMTNWKKGMVYVNGRNIGRFWEIGPQQTLYLPGCWLKNGENEIIVLDIAGTDKPLIKGLRQPILDVVRGNGAYKFRKQGENLDLSKETPVYSGSFKPGNGWQKINFVQSHKVKYFCLEALNSHGNDDFASIAELEILGKDGKPLSRQHWKIVYADSEEADAANQIATNVFDLQESTIWHTSYFINKDRFPHHIVIDLGEDKEITGFEYLPRQETNKPGMIKDFKIYIKTSPFKL